MYLHRDTSQYRLSTEQVEAFYHDDFVSYRVGHFTDLMPSSRPGAVVTDVGYCCSFFARALSHNSGKRKRFIDMDPSSAEACRGGGGASRGSRLAHHGCADR